MAKRATVSDVAIGPSSGEEDLVDRSNKKVKVNEKEEGGKLVEVVMKDKGELVEN